MPYNAQVDRFNLEKLNSIPGKAQMYKATVT
jgi:hypothetical protein